MEVASGNDALPNHMKSGTRAGQENCSVPLVTFLMLALTSCQGRLVGSQLDTRQGFRSDLFVVSVARENVVTTNGGGCRHNVLCCMAPASEMIVLLMGIECFFVHIAFDKNETLRVVVLLINVCLLYTSPSPRDS